MGKVVKQFIIGACICIMVGMVIFVGAVMFGGISGAKAILEKDGFIGRTVSGGIIGISKDDHKRGKTSSEHVIHLEGEALFNLEMELVNGDFEIIEGDSSDIIINANKKINVAQKGNNISIRTPNQGLFGQFGNKGYRVTIEVPKGIEFNDVNVEIGAGVLTCPKLMANSLTMEIGAGTIQMEEYSARRASITVGAGEIIVDRGRVNDMDIEVGMGSFFFQGNIDGDLDVECGMGNTELELEASEEDYNYQIDCGMGNVTVGSASYSGVGAGHKIDNNSEFDFDLECGMGNLEIRFVE